MKPSKSVAFLAIIAATALPSFGAIDGSLKILSPTTNQPISTVRIGKQFKVRLAVNDLNLIANKNITYTYVLSVLPKGSNTPVTISGKISGRFTLPASEGGAVKTRDEMADLAGTQVTGGIMTVPDFMPVGTATLTISLTTPNVGNINFSKNLKIQL
jgi:hypothetical protein